MYQRTRVPFACAIAAVLFAAGCALPPRAEESGAAPSTAPDRSPAVTPFLMFQDGRADEAMRFYAKLFPHSSIVALDLYGANEIGEQGTVRLGIMNLSGQRVMCSDSPIRHAFDFTPSVSFWYDCASAQELDQLFTALSGDGVVMMPPGSYGFSPRFA